MKYSFGLKFRLKNSIKSSERRALIDINKNFLYNPVRPPFWEVVGTLIFPLLNL
jgi:hypothetical protein